MIFMAAGFLLITGSVSANNFGFRGGYDTDFEQALLGFQTELGKVIEIARFAPSVDYGFGNDLTTFAFNGDIRIFLTPPAASATIYGGAGLTVFLIEPKGGDTDTDWGLTLSGGVKFGAGKGRVYNLEGRFGIDDMPEFRILFGIFF
jgi:hypothetical protein